MVDQPTNKANRLQPFLLFVSASGGKFFSPTVLFLLILGFGIAVRTWDFPKLPPGLNQDEATIGVEAYDLLHYGVDRNGNSFPVNFVSWGNGMDALYGYVLIPFVAFGLTPLTVRLPSLLAGILTLPLIYFIGKRSVGETFGLLSMFLLAISPWHILMSRWGINENILPFMFAFGYLCLLLSSKANGWFVAGAGSLGLCLYSYGATYVAVPIFLACAIAILVKTNRVSSRSLIIGLIIFTILAIPLFLFILVNALGWDSLRIGPFTVPRLPVQARFLGMLATSHANPILTMINNLRGLIKLLLVYQSDQQVWNSVEPFGYMYAFAFPFAVIGAILLFPSRKSTNIPEHLLVLAWLVSSLLIGVFQYANINRIHLVFIPIILCIAYFLTWLGERSRSALIAVILIYLTSFFIFTNIYHGDAYLKQAESAFFAGLIPALEDTRQMGARPVCVTDKVNMPYIYALFVEKTPPTLFLSQAKYENPDLHSGRVLSFGRYSFGLENCPNSDDMIYILSRGEQPPRNGIVYAIKEFGNYQVYIP